MPPLLPLVRALVKDRSGPRKRGRGCLLYLEVLEPRLAPSAVPLALSGFNQDLIFAPSESSAQAGTTTTLDGVNVLYGAGAGTLPAANGLPSTGTFTSAADPAVSFSLAPYTSNNALFLSTSRFSAPTTGTLTLSTPGQFADLHILDVAAGAYYGTNYNITLTFSDGSTAAVTGLLSPDWIAGTGQGYPGAITNLGRVDRSTGSLYPPTATLFEADISVPAADQAKTLQSLTFQVTGGGNLAVFAVSANPASGGVPLQLGTLSQTQWAVNESGETATIAVSGGTAPYSGLTTAGMPGGLTASLSGSTVTFSGTPTATGTYHVNISLSDSAGDVASNWYTITVTLNPVLSISASPQSATIDDGQVDTLRVTATGGTTPYRYQWFSGTPGSGTAIGGATGSSYTASPTSTASYYVVVTDSNLNTVISSAATVTVSPALSITAQPQSAAIDDGQSETLRITATGGTTPYFYQWYTSGTAISGATGSTLTVSPSSTTNYWAAVTDSANGTPAAEVDSSTATITVNPRFQLGALSLPPSQWTVGQGGGTATVQVSGGVGPYSILSSSGLPDGLTLTLTGSTLTVRGTPALSGTFPVQISLADALDNVAAGTFTVTIHPAPAPSETPTSSLDTAASTLVAALTGGGKGGEGMASASTSAASGGNGASSALAGSNVQTLSASAPLRATAAKPFTQTMTGNSPSSEGSDGAAAGAVANQSASVPALRPSSTDASGDGNSSAANASQASSQESSANDSLSAFLAATQASISQKVAVVIAGSAASGAGGGGMAGVSANVFSGARPIALAGAELENALLFGSGILPTVDESALLRAAGVADLDTEEGGQSARNAAVDEAFANLETLQLGMMWLVLAVTAGEITMSLSAKGKDD